MITHFEKGLEFWAALFSWCHGKDWSSECAKEHYRSRSSKISNLIYRILVIFFNSKWVWHENSKKYVTNSSLLGLRRYRVLNKIIFSNTTISGSSPCPILLRPVPCFSNPIYRIWEFIGPCFIPKTGSFMTACAICRHETTPCHTCNVLLHIHCFSPFHGSSWTIMLKFPIIAENGYSSKN